MVERWTMMRNGGMASWGVEVVPAKDYDALVAKQKADEDRFAALLNSICAEHRPGDYDRDHWPSNALRCSACYDALQKELEEAVGNGCWKWRGRIGSEGYGMLGGSQYAHRLSYETFVGSIPPDKQLDHLCRNRDCVNPWHLEPVTRRENILRGVGATAMNARKTHCQRGHPLTDDNLVKRAHSRQGGFMRECRKCRSLTRNRSRALARHEAKREEK